MNLLLGGSVMTCGNASCVEAEEEKEAGNGAGGGLVHIQQETTKIDH